MKEDKNAMEKFRDKEKLQIQEYEIKESAESPEASILSPSKVYGTRQSFDKAIRRVKRALPASPPK